MRNAFRGARARADDAVRGRRRRRDGARVRRVCSGRRSRSSRKTVDMAGQVAALALVISTIAFGSLAARAASSEAVRAGSPENEFLLARPVSLASLVAARGLADAVTDPVGALFLLPVLISAARRLAPGRAGWPMAIVDLDADAGGDLDARLCGAAGGGPLRARPAAPDDVDGAAPGGGAVAGDALDARHLGDAGARGAGDQRRARWRRSSRCSPAHAGQRAAGGAGARRAGGRPCWRCWRWPSPSPCAMLAGGDGRAPRRDGGLGGGGRGLGGGGARAAGWRPPADGGDQGSAPDRARSIAAAGADRDAGDLHRRPDLRRRGLELDDRQPGRGSRASRTRWRSTWRTIGPLTHMQAERRAFWILRTVPVPLGRLLAAKARAWAVIVGGIGGGGVRGDVVVGAGRVGRRAAGRGPAGHGGRGRA